MAWGVQYPVDFRSGGDTTSKAFEKHINEISAIYGKLNDLNNDKLDSTALSGLQNELTNHKNSTNPHPNWTPVTSWETINALLTAARINTLLGKPGVDITKIANFETAVNSLINMATGNLNIPEAAITESTLEAKSGYVKFNNSFLVQWGYGEGDETRKLDVVTEFKVPFTTFNTVILTYEGAEDDGDTTTYWLLKKTLKDFTWRVSYMNYGIGAPYGRKMFFVALGK